jgi:hypothetical protein
MARDIRYYNFERRHSGIKYCPPAQFEQIIKLKNKRMTCPIDEERWTQRGTITPSGPENDLIDLIFSLDAGYCDDLPYFAFPNANNSFWNSNSYAHGVLNALEASDSGITVDVNLGSLSFPGWDKPLGTSIFENDAWGEPVCVDRESRYVATLFLNTSWESVPIVGQECMSTQNFG